MSIKTRDASRSPLATGISLGDLRRDPGSTEPRDRAKGPETKYKARNMTEGGITLLLTVVILAALLSISIGIFNVVLGQIEISGDLNDSFIAHYAATHAIEKMLFMDRNLGICTGGPGDPCAENLTDVASGGCYKTRVVKSGGNTILETFGQYRCGANPNRVVKRRLFLTYVSGGGDTTPPAAIISLALSGATASSINLNWTSPGDDGASGTASSYDVRYSTSPITETNWGLATGATGEPTPLVAGSTQSMTVSGLSASTLYNFAIKTSDEVPNVSGLSNVPSLATLSVPAIIAFDTATSIPGQVTSPTSFTITTTQPNEVILLGIMVSNGASGIPPTATLDGVAMTPIQTVAAGTASTGFLRLLWGIAASAGPHTITSTVSFSGGNGWSATAVALQNVNTTSPVDVSVGSTGATSASVTTTVANTWLVSVGGYSSVSFGSNISFSGSFTERIDSLVPAEVAMATLPTPTPGFYSSSWSNSTPISGAAATILVGVKP